MMSDKVQDTWESLKDADYRREWAEEHVGVGLAFQIRALREDRKWTQTELGERGGTKQETLSQWENPNYGNYTLKTLKRLAAAFDVGLLVRFVPFSELVNWTVGITADRLAPPRYEQEVAAEAKNASGLLVSDEANRARIHVAHDPVRETLTVYWAEPRTEHICEEAGEGVILIKDARTGEVIGFERLHYRPESGVQSITVETSPVPS